MGEKNKDNILLQLDVYTNHMRKPRNICKFVFSLKYIISVHLRTI